MILLEDTRNQDTKHIIKHQYFEQHGIEVRRTKLYCGDYTLPTNQSICVDTKKDIQELIGDICGKQHERFRNECIRANEAGIQLIILVENEAEWLDKKHTIRNNVVRSVNDLFRWKNKRAFIWKGGKQVYPNCTKGSTLAKACMSMEKKYGVKFMFCTPKESPKKIIDLLNNG